MKQYPTQTSPLQGRRTWRDRNREDPQQTPFGGRAPHRKQDSVGINKSAHSGNYKTATIGPCDGCSSTCQLTSSGCRHERLDKPQAGNLRPTITLDLFLYRSRQTCWRWMWMVEVLAGVWMKQIGVCICRIVGSGYTTFCPSCWWSSLFVFDNRILGVLGLAT